MQTIPAVRPDLTPDFVAEDRVMLRSHTDSRCVEGDLLCAVIGRINGRRDRRQIAGDLSGLYRAEEVHYALAFLEKQEVTVEAHDALIPGAEWWYRAGVPVAVAHNRLASMPVRIVSMDGMDSDPFAKTFQALGGVVNPDAPLAVALTDDPFNEACQNLHRESVASGEPWMLVWPASNEGWIGPLFRPRITGCLECLRWRVQENHFQVTAGCLPAPALHLQAAAIQLAMWIAGQRREIEGALLTFDTIRLSHTRHVLTRRPQCSCCGAPQPALPGPELAMESRRRVVGGDGGYRILTAQATRENLRHHVSPTTGLVRGVYPHSAGGTTIPVFTAPWNGLVGSTANRNSRAGEAEAATGKGLSPDQAWSSCVAEALERISAGYCGDEPMVRSSWRNLGSQAVHPGELLLYSARQYKRRERWNAKSSPEEQVPHPFNDDAEVEWCPAWSLRDSKIRYLPAAFALTGYRFREALRYCRGDSNGCAGGNTIEEAVLQGFLELVERDAAGIWWYNRVERRAVDMESFEMPALTELRDGLAVSGRCVHLLDITTDLRIPCFVATSYKDGDGAASVGLGFGAHLDPRIAASRALTELQQCHARQVVRPVQPLSGNQHCIPLPHGHGSEEWRKIPFVSNPDIRDDILHCVEITASAGMDFIVLNLTRPEIGFPVVRVAVPGLRHIRPRFAPGRLYDVPVAMGWRDAPLKESGLNQEPVPL